MMGIGIVGRGEAQHDSESDDSDQEVDSQLARQGELREGEVTCKSISQADVCLIIKR